MFSHTAFVICVLCLKTRYVKMTEETIFKTLLNLAGFKEFSDFPKVQPEAVEIIAKSFTDIVYNSFQVKSASSATWRSNVLKIINCICRRKVAHNYTNLDDALKIINDFLNDSLKDSWFLKEFAEIEDLRDDFSFFQEKHAIEEEKIKRLEFIKKYDRQQLNEKFDMEVKNFTYQHDKGLLLGEFLKNYYDCDRISTGQSENLVRCRSQLIELGYAVLLMKSDLSKEILKNICHILAQLDLLKAEEEHFLHYLWFLDEKPSEMIGILKDNFFFILERIVISHGTNILKLPDNDVISYIDDLENHKTTLTIKTVCRNDALVGFRIKSLIYTLYCYSYCNRNIFKLMKILL